MLQGPDGGLHKAQPGGEDSSVAKPVYAAHLWCWEVVHVLSLDIVSSRSSLSRSQARGGGITNGKITLKAPDGAKHYSRT